MYEEILEKIKKSNALSNDERQHIEDLIIKDELTGIYNRRHFNKELSSRIEKSKRIGYDLTLLMVDIDFFKKYNDINGHQKGDKILKRVAMTIDQSIRDIDSLFRYGGEEYAVLLPNANKVQGVEVAERMRVSVERFTPVTVSVGLSVYDKISHSLHDFISDSDYALYDAKRNGRNQVKVYEPTK